MRSKSFEPHFLTEFYVDGLENRSELSKVNCPRQSLGPFEYLDSLGGHAQSFRQVGA
jgi:hypothetical protein